MSDNLAEEYADTMVASLSEAWQAIDGAVTHWDGDGVAETLRAYGVDAQGYGDVTVDNLVDGQDPWDALYDRPLEIVREVGKRFEILLTFGGPNAWIESDADGNHARLVVGWGGQTARRYRPVIDRTAEFFAGMYE